MTKKEVTETHLGLIQYHLERSEGQLFSHGGHIAATNQQMVLEFASISMTKLTRESQSQTTD